MPIPAMISRRRTKQVESVRGPLRLERTYYHCASCGNGRLSARVPSCSQLTPSSVLRGSVSINIVQSVVVFSNGCEQSVLD